MIRCAILANLTKPFIKSNMVVTIGVIAVVIVAAIPVLAVVIMIMVVSIIVVVSIVKICTKKLMKIIPAVICQ